MRSRRRASECDVICTLIPDDVIPELPITPKPDALRREAVGQVGVDTPFVAAMPRSEDKQHHV